MPVYRTLKPMSKGFNKTIPAGCIVNLNWLDDEQLARLIQVGAIARLQTPPLEKFPGWQTRGKKLRKAGYPSVEIFLEGDDEVLAEKMRVKPRTVRRWKSELIECWLVIPQDKRR